MIAQIDKVENLRAELNKGRTLMIYRMNKLLTPDQRAKVKAMYDAARPAAGAAVITVAVTSRFSSFQSWRIS